MSDPVTNVAIEDVLSSIRRLVSEDARVQPLAWRQEQKEAEAAEAEPEAAPHAGRLVLTPALRVTEEDDAPATAPVAEVGATEAGKGADDVAPDAPEMTEEAALAGDAPQAQAWGDEAAALGEDPVQEAGPDLAAEAATEAGGADPYVLGEAAVEAMVWEDHHDDDVPQGQDAVEADDLTDDMSGDLTGDAAAQTMTMSEGAASVPEDESGGFVFASTRDGGLRDEAFAAAHAAQAADAGDPDDRALLLRDDEAILDEDMLRELVTEIVRQELQGALGERITRNVRKLVRREIHRALTSHELE